MHPLVGWSGAAIVLMNFVLMIVNATSSLAANQLGIPSVCNALDSVEKLREQDQYATEKALVFPFVS